MERLRAGRPFHGLRRAAAATLRLRVLSASVSLVDGFEYRCSLAWDCLCLRGGDGDEGRCPVFRLEGEAGKGAGGLEGCGWETDAGFPYGEGVSGEEGREAGDADERGDL